MELALGSALLVKRDPLPARSKQAMAYDQHLPRERPPIPQQENQGEHRECEQDGPVDYLRA